MTDGLARKGFDVDLAEGLASENDFLNAVRLARVECKDERGKSQTTGNVFIEYKDHGRPSGIATTVAEWWSARLADDVFVVIRTSLLRALVRKAYGDGRRTKGGDFNKYEGVLVPCTWLVAPEKALFPTQGEFEL